MSQRDYIEERYGDGECGPFAQALHEITGLPLVTFGLQEAADYLPKAFPRHAAVVMEPGVYIDAHGRTTIDDIEKRLGVALYPIANPQVNVYPLEAGPGCSLHDDSEFSEAIEHAMQMLEMHDLSHLERPKYGAPTMGRS